MRADDLFIEVPEEGGGLVSWATQLELNVDLVEALQKSPVRGRDEVAMAQALVDLVYEELSAFGTSGGERLTNDEIALTIRAMRAVLKRLGVPVDLPFRDFVRFRNYWLRNDASGSYQNVGTSPTAYSNPLRPL